MTLRWRRLRKVLVKQIVESCAVVRNEEYTEVKRHKNAPRDKVGED